MHAEFSELTPFTPGNRMETRLTDDDDMKRGCHRDGTRGVRAWLLLWWCLVAGSARLLLPFLARRSPLHITRDQDTAADDDQ